MKKYEILEHKADLKIRAFGKTKEELFLNMMLGMQESLQAEKRKEEAKREIKIESNDLNSLLVDFLSELNYLNETEKEVYNDIKFKEFSAVKIKGEVLGQKVESFEEDIKAVTYHSLDIHQKNGIWQATVLFDI